jgi:hypothetical protein
MSTVSVPKFNPSLGTLIGINFTLSATSNGAARAENTSSSSSQVTLTFQNTVTLTRPDLSVIVVTIPQAVFMDTLGPFDGMIDFGGTSGISHNNLVASDSDMVSSPPPASDLVLFSGAGNIVLPVSAVGTSTAQGGGNVTSQFTSSASADLQVCYQYIPNTPPAFTQPSCGATLMASVGVPFSFQVCAGDIEAGDTVTIAATGLPAGASSLPLLPQSGNPVCSTISWTPASNQVGPNVFSFSATDTHGRTSNCSITVMVAECHLLLGQAAPPGSGIQVDIFGHLYDTQLSTLRGSAPVTMTDIPYVGLPVNGHIAAQIVMYNPLVFPQNPSQWSRVATVTMNPNGTISSAWSGVRNGISLRPDTVLVNGLTRIVFRFTIDGM